MFSIDTTDAHRKLKSSIKILSDCNPHCSIWFRHDSWLENVPYCHACFFHNFSDRGYSCFKVEWQWRWILSGCQISTKRIIFFNQLTDWLTDKWMNELINNMSMYVLKTINVFECKWTLIYHVFFRATGSQKVEQIEGLLPKKQEASPNLQIWGCRKEPEKMVPVWCHDFSGAIHGWQADNKQLIRTLGK